MERRRRRSPDPPAGRKHRTTVRLVGIRLREQGTHDSFCAYYAAAMLLCTLRPEMDDEFDATHVARNPLFRNLPRPSGQTLDCAVADWLTAGVHFGPLARALDGACGGKTRFRATREPFGRKTLEMLRLQVDRGLPSVLGWESGELGNHTVLVVGYDRCASHARDRWLRVLDPTGKLDVLESGFSSSASRARPPTSSSAPTTTAGGRDRLSVDRDVEGAHLGSRIERWSLQNTRFETLVAR